MDTPNNLELEETTEGGSFITNIRSLTRIAPIIAMVLAMTACEEKELDPNLQEAIEACRLDVAEIEGVLIGLDVDLSKGRLDSNPYKSSGSDALKACKLERARFNGLLLGVDRNKSITRALSSEREDREDELRKSNEASEFLDKMGTLVRGLSNPAGGDVVVEPVEGESARADVIVEGAVEGKPAGKITRKQQIAEDRKLFGLESDHPRTKTSREKIDEARKRFKTSEPE